MTQLYKMRKLRKMRLREVGERLGITPQGVKRQETTGIKKMSTAARYAKALNCKPLDIIEL